MVRRRKKRPDPIQSAAARRSTYRRWRRWFAEVKDQILDIHHRRHVYREVMAMVDANSALQVPSAFYGWMRIAYINDMTVAIRRLVDWNKRSISFVKLIEEIADHPEVITRRRFVARYQGWLRGAGHRDFELFASPAAKRIHRRVIERHRRELVVAQRRLRQFVNRHAAHRDRTPMRRLPTYAELDDCIDLLGRLAKDYSLLLEQAALIEVVPIIQGDWKAPFRVPWIQAPVPASPPSAGIAAGGIPVNPRTVEQPWFVGKVLGDEEWQRDPEAKARRVAQQVMARPLPGDPRTVSNPRDF